MPRKPKRPCSFPGCPRLTDGRFCDEHTRAESKRYERYDRSAETRERYGKAWRAVRSRFLAEHPFCAECQRQGRLTRAAEMHHVLPLARGGTNDVGNLMALCKACHSRITARDGDRWHG